MKAITWVFGALAGLATGSYSLAAATPAAPAAPEASIPFVARGGIRDWRVHEDTGMWVQGRGGKWYYATFFGSCPGIQFQNAVRFNAGGTDRLDKWSSVSSRLTGRCYFKSFTASDPPPNRKQHRAAPATPAAPAAIG